jgi:hypothetical protein
MDWERGHGHDRDLSDSDNLPRVSAEWTENEEKLTEFHSVYSLHALAGPRGSSLNGAGDDAQEYIVIQNDEPQTASCGRDIAMIGEIEG